MNNKRELLLKVLSGEASVNILDSRPWLKILRTYLADTLIHESLYATKDCFDGLTEKDKIEPSRFKEIEKELLAGNLFALTFYAERRFIRPEDVTRWSAFSFGSYMPAGLENVTELKEIKPTPIEITLFDETDYQLGF